MKRKVLDALQAAREARRPVALVTDLATATQSASSRLEEATVLETALKTQRDSVSAVSLDEETTDLLRFQKAYQANAKVISVIDEMLQSLIAMIR